MAQPDNSWHSSQVQRLLSDAEVIHMDSPTAGLVSFFRRCRVGRSVKRNRKAVQKLAEEMEEEIDEADQIDDVRIWI